MPLFDDVQSLLEHPACCAAWDDRATFWGLIDTTARALREGKLDRSDPELQRALEDCLEEKRKRTFDPRLLAEYLFERGVTR